MLDPILELRGGSVYYPGGKQALKQVSAAFYPGEKTAVIGNNGAGKSTFFQTLNRLVPLDEGELSRMSRMLLKSEFFSCLNYFSFNQLFPNEVCSVSA